MGGETLIMSCAENTTLLQGAYNRVFDKWKQQAEGKAEVAKGTGGGGGE